MSVATLKSSYVPLGDGGAEAEHVTLLAALERLPDSIRMHQRVAVARRGRHMSTLNRTLRYVKNVLRIGKRRETFLDLREIENPLC